MHVFKTSQNVIHLFQVRHHKTQATGAAGLVVSPLEKAWLRDLIHVMEQNNVESEYVFSTATGRRVKKLGKYLKEEWKNAGLKSEANFNLIRSSAASKVSFTKQTL